MFLVDTNILVYATQQRLVYLRWLQNQLSRNKVRLSVIAFAEFQTGSYGRDEEWMDDLADRLGVIEIDRAIASQAASYRKYFRKLGYRIRLPDAFMAATAKLHTFTLVTNNPKHFPMKDIKITRI